MMLPRHMSAWRPAPFVLGSLILHLACLITLFLRPAMWPWILGALAGNQLALIAAVLWPRGRLLGPNLLRLPESAARRGQVALTFDDGPDPGVTPQVLELLDRWQAKASFFCVGEKAAAHPELVMDIARRGHSVENHSYFHPRAFAFYGYSRLRHEVELAQSVIAGITGRPPGFFRAPAGFRSPFLDAVLAERGLRHVSWTRRGLDTVSRNPLRVLQRLVRGLAAGDVLLLHDGSHSRTDAGEPLVLAVLPALLEELRQGASSPCPCRLRTARIARCRSPWPLRPSTIPKGSTVMLEQSQEDHLQGTSQQGLKSPIPMMRGYFSNDAEKSRFIARLFNDTAADYDLMERILGLGNGSRYRGQALERAGLTAGMRVIDIAVGTGLVAREAVRIAGDPSLVVGVDPSAGMLMRAKVPPGVCLVEGRAEAIPFPDARFDFLSMGFALRHISDLSTAFGEFRRVVKPAARICILEITPPESRVGKALLKTYMHVLVPAVARFLATSADTEKLWRYYWETIEACAAPERVIATLRACGFARVRRQVSHGIFSEYQGVRPS